MSTTTNPNVTLASGIFVTAADIASALHQTDATAAGLDASVNACKTIDPLLKAQWVAFYDGYQKFSQANQNLGFFTLGLANIGDQVVSYEGQLDMWSEVISKSCPNFQPPPGQAHDPANQGLSTGTKWLIGAGIAAAGLFVLSPLISELAIALRTRRELRPKPRPPSDRS
jgi:hypothetical protein